MTATLDLTSLASVLSQVIGAQLRDIYLSHDGMCIVLRTSMGDVSIHNNIEPLQTAIDVRGFTPSEHFRSLK